MDMTDNNPSDTSEENDDFKEINMNRRDLFPELNLTLFDGGAGGDGGGQAAGPEGEGETGASAEAQKLLSKGRREKSNVVYGKQAEQTESESSGNAEGGKEKPAATGPSKEAFEKLIKGEYKPFFEEKTQSIIDSRFKQTKTLEKQLGEISPVLEGLMTKYGVSDGDMTKLKEAIDSDNAFWEELAEKEGLSVDQYKQVKRMESENAAMKAVIEDAQRSQALSEAYQAWRAEESQLQKEYPGFSFDEEINNPQFVQLISNGIDMKAAFEAVHLNDILEYAVKSAKSQTAETIRAKGLRPSENGTAAAQSGLVFKTKASDLTKEDRAEIARRVARGENIIF